MKNRFAVILLSCGLTASWAGAEEPKAEPKIKIKLGTIAPADSPWHDALKSFKKDTEARTNGRMQVQLYMGGKLGSEAEMVKQVTFGSTECIGVSTGSLADIIPDFDVFELPFLWDHPNQPLVAMKLVQPYFRDALAKKGLRLVGWSENGWRNFMTGGKPIRGVGDMVGFKMRSQENKFHMALWQALGAKPVPLATTEFAKAMQSGLIEGGENSIVLTAAFGWAEVIKSITISRHIFQPAVVVCNQAWFNKLPQAEQSQIDEFMAGISDRVHEKLDAAEKEFIQMFKERGIEVVELSPEARADFTAKSAPVRARFQKTISPEVMKMIEKAKRQ